MCVQFVRSGRIDYCMGGKGGKSNSKRRHVYSMIFNKEIIFWYTTVLLGPSISFEHKCTLEGRVVWYNAP